MTEDARFEEGRERPVNLAAFDAEDLTVLSALVQDAVFPANEMKFERGARRFSLLINRFRWEDEGTARHAPERVQSVLSFANVEGVASQGIPQRDSDTVLSLLKLEFEEGEAPSGHLQLILAGDGAIRLKVEAVEVRLKDVTRPYLAPSKKRPGHPD